MVDTARITLLPAFKLAVSDCVAQVAQAPVPLNASDELITVPLTLIDIARLLVVPLA